MTQRTARKAQNFVRGETNTLELANLGHAINLRVYRRRKMKGRLLVGQGALAWIPRGWQKRRKRAIPWDVFAVMMKEWPFGSPIRARLKFVDGAMRWRSPNKRGAGRRVSWEELQVRLDTPLTTRQKDRIKKLEAQHRAASRKRRKPPPPPP